MWLIFILIGIGMLLLGIFILAAKFLIWLGTAVAVISIIMWISHAIAHGAPWRCYPVSKSPRLSKRSASGVWLRRTPRRRKRYGIASSWHRNANKAQHN